MKENQEYFLKSATTFLKEIQASWHSNSDGRPYCIPTRWKRKQHKRKRLNLLFSGTQCCGNCPVPCSHQFIQGEGWSPVGSPSSHLHCMGVKLPHRNHEGHSNHSKGPYPRDSEKQKMRGVLVDK